MQIHFFINHHTPMKRILLLIALLAFGASASFAQVQRRVLEEEFTNTGCPPCAATDPLVEDFENQNMDKICVLKYHTSWPDPSDPFYLAQKTKTWNDARIQSYYGQNGVPFVKFSGKTEPMTRIFDGSGQYTISATLPGDLRDSMNAVYTMTSPYTIDITQQIVGDSIIAVVTVKTVSAPPSQTDLRLACVFGERYNPYHGSNGRPFYTSIVRSVLPGIAANGSISTTASYPVFNLANGQTQTIRFADKIGTTWNRKQMMTAAFIQSAGTKEIFQANWTVPNITLDLSSTTDFAIAPNSSQSVTINNLSNTSQKVTLDYTAADMPASWKASADAADANGAITIPAKGSTTINLTMSVTGKAIGSANGMFGFTSVDGVGIGGAGISYFGADNTDVIVDGGVGAAVLTPELTDMNANGLQAGIVARSQFMTNFNDWTQFKTVYIAAGDNVGIQVGTNEWGNVADHLAAGGNILFTGSRTIGIYQSSGNDIYMQNWRDNFHIDPTANTTSTWSKVTGVTNDPIGNGVSSTLNPKTNYRQGLVASDDGFMGIFANEKKDTVGMRALTGTGKVVYLAFELESLPAADRTNVSKRIIDWFNGAASVKTSNNATDVKIANYPNPVSKNTTFNYSLTQRGTVNLAIYDVMGREVSRLVSNETQDQGTYTADFDASHLATGSYTYVLTTNGNKVTGTMAVTK
jgi:hypothetical protein